MAEFTLNNQNYRTSKMDAMKQFHITRRLLPVLSSLAQLAKLDVKDMTSALPVIAEAMSAMSEENSNYVINHCLLHCSRMSGGSWSAVAVRDTVGLMFDDIDLPTMLQLVWKVLEDNLGNFFPTLPAKDDV